MHYDGLKRLASSGALASVQGPVAAIIAEDEAQVEATIAHHRDRGFRSILLFAPAELSLDMDASGPVIRIDFATRSPDAAPTIVNALVAALPAGTWLYYCFNAEFLFYPFAEHRTVGEMLAFHAEERRASMLTYVIDAYAGDLTSHDDAVSLSDTWLDRSGYYANARVRDGEGLERQLDFHGGLRWRFEEHVPSDRRRIDRIAIVRTAPGIRLRPDHTWSQEELNTFACPWHNNLTAAIISFRAAKALCTNPASQCHIDSFRWHNSLRFKWQSQQLMDLGLMEPGQWF